MVNPETRSELAIPMIHQGRVVGVLDLESPQVNYFTEDHVQTLMILAAHLAVSLENARLYEKLAKRRSAHGARTHRRAALANRAAASRSRRSIMAWTSPRAFIPRAKFAATCTIFFPTARSNWASRWETSAERAAPRRCMARWPPEFCAAFLRTSFSPRNFCAS